MNSKKSLYTIRDLIIDDEYDIIEQDASVKDAAKKMKQKAIPDLVVIEKDSKKVLGVVADFDIVQNLVAEGLDASKTPVQKVMYVITPVTLDTPVKEAFERMRSLNVNVVPVVDNGKFLGVASIQDCWSYIPDETVDEIGMIPVSNPKNAEFWFASVCSLLAFVLGILLPMLGFFGYYSGNPSDLTALFGLAEIRGGLISFSLFQAQGSEFLSSLGALSSLNGPIWIILEINAFLLLIVGIIGLFSLIYSSFSDMRSIRTSGLVRNLLPLLVIGFMILEWILYGIAFALSTVTISINGVGVALSIISILLILVATLRDFIFVQKTSPEKNIEVSN